MLGKARELWQRRRWPFVAGAGVLLAGATVGGARLAQTAPRLPTAEVKRGDFIDSIEVRGEVKALKSLVLTAPSNAGDIQIVRLVKNGTVVKPGDIVVEFDATALQNTLDQKRSELKEADAEIERARAEAHLQQEQDTTELTTARYDVERARLDTTNQEFISRLEAEKHKLTLAAAKQRLREVEKRIESNRAAEAAEIESRKQKREKALFEVRQAERNIAAMVLRAPTAGMVTLLPNWRARTSFVSGGAPEFREGDRAWPGAAVAELPDLSTVRVNARIEEIDRSRLRVGQAARVRVDAVPDKELAGSVADVSAMAKPDFSGWPPTKNFDLALQLDQNDPRLRPGMSATARIEVVRVPDSILVPTEAVFQKGRRTVAYVLRGSRFTEREIEVAHRSKAHAAIARGLEPGEKVATKDPTLEEAPGVP